MRQLLDRPETYLLFGDRDALTEHNGRLDVVLAGLRADGMDRNLLDGGMGDIGALQLVARHVLSTATEVILPASMSDQKLVTEKLGQMATRWPASIAPMTAVCAVL